jgi:hypothetical protein
VALREQPSWKRREVDRCLGRVFPSTNCKSPGAGQPWPICTCVPLDHVCTGNLNVAVIPGICEIDQENCLVVFLTLSW